MAKDIELRSRDSIGQASVQYNNTGKQFTQARANMVENVIGHFPPIQLMSLCHILSSLPLFFVFLRLSLFLSFPTRRH